MSDVIVRRFDRGYGEVRVMLTVWRGRPRADLRLWIPDVGPDEDTSDRLRPTPKGVQFFPEELPALLEAVEALIEAHELAAGRRAA